MGNSTTANSTGSSVNTTELLATQYKSRKPSDSGDMGKAASAPRKRSRKANDDKVTTKVSDGVETGEKPMKCAKFEEASSTAQLPSAESKDTFSDAKETRLTDVQRVLRYKTIGSRGERARLTGLNSAEQSRRKTSLVAKAAESLNSSDTGLGDHTVDKSVVVSESSQSLSVPASKRSARRVPFVTVSDNLPATPTLFTLRSRARLAQMQSKNGSQNISQDGAELQSAILETGFKMNSAQTAVDGKCLQTKAYVGGVHSAVLVSDSSCIKISNVSDTALSQITDEAVCSKLLDHRTDDEQLHLLEKPNTDPASQAATLTTNVESNKLSVSGKTSATVSTSVVGNFTSSVHKTPEVTRSELESKPGNDRNVADSGRKTSKKDAQLCIETRSSKRTANTGSCKTVSSSKNDQDNPHHVIISSTEPYLAKTGHDTKGDSKQRSAARKSTISSSHNKCEPLKPRQTVSENSMKVDGKKPKVPPKETVAYTGAKNTAGKVTKDAEITKQQNSECRNDQSGSLQGSAVECGNKAKLQDVRPWQESQAVVASEPRNCANTSAVGVKLSVASNKDLSLELDPHSVVQRKSARTDLNQSLVDNSVSAATESQALMKCKLTTPKMQVNDSDLAAKAGSSLTRLSMGHKDLIDLMDVAIAGTPAQYPNADDSSDSLLLSPFNVSVGGETDRDDVVFNNSDFIVPENPAAELADGSVCGQCAMSFIAV